MITLLVGLGLVMLAAGVAAIVDGLPYLVLERGFTEVIVGAVLVVGGVVVLCCAVLAAEIRRVGRKLSAAIGRDGAGLAPLPAAPVAPVLPAVAALAGAAALPVSLAAPDPRPPGDGLLAETPAPPVEIDPPREPPAADEPVAIDGLDRLRRQLALGPPPPVADADSDQAASVAAGDGSGADRLAAPPAASDEGIISAYQIGDRHFTMFADGSIKARTPEGDFTFASLGELKAFLAEPEAGTGSRA